MPIMAIPWGIIIAVFVLGLAYLIKDFLANIIEDEHTFLAIIGGFLVIYIFAAAMVGSLNPLTLVSTQVSADQSGLVP